MGRTNNQNKLCYSVSVVIGLGDDIQILHDKNYTTLREIANDLNLPYQQVADISIGRSKRFKTSFKYQPRINIQKLSLNSYTKDVKQEKEKHKEEEAVQVGKG